MFNESFDETREESNIQVHKEADPLTSRIGFFMDLPETIKYSFSTITLLSKLTYK
jgi:hypothetical protein